LTPTRWSQLPTRAIDPELDALQVYRRVGERDERAAELTLEAGNALTSPLLPDLDLPLSKIFEESRAGTGYNPHFHAAGLKACATTRQARPPPPRFRSGL
jgi:hypothetical protein